MGCLIDLFKKKHAFFTNYLDDNVCFLRMVHSLIGLSICKYNYTIVMFVYIPDK